MAARGGGLREDTIRTHLKACQQYGLVERNSSRGQLWRRLVGPEDVALLDSLAKFTGSYGHRASTQALNERERDVADQQFKSATGMTRSDFELAR